MDNMRRIAHDLIATGSDQERAYGHGMLKAFEYMDNNSYVIAGVHASIKHWTDTEDIRVVAEDIMNGDADVYAVDETAAINSWDTFVTISRAYAKAIIHYEHSGY